MFGGVIVENLYRDVEGRSYTKSLASPIYVLSETIICLAGPSPVLLVYVQPILFVVTAATHGGMVKVVVLVYTVLFI